MKKMLITGANGFVGQHLAKELADNGIEAIGIGGSNGNSVASPYLTKYSAIDLLDTKATSAIDFSNIDGVVHLAGLAAVGPSFDDPRKYMETNIGIESNLFEVAQKQGAYPKFIIVSSGSLYDANSKLPILETTTVLPNSPYAVSKLAQEQLARYYMTRGFAVVIARPFNHIGPGQTTGFIVPDLTKQAVEFSNNAIDKISVGNLDAKRDYTDVRDIARAYRLLLEHGRSGETYNICSGVSRSGHELLDMILNAADVNPEIVPDPTRMRPSDAPDLYGSYAKLEHATGWKPEISLDQTISDTLNYWRQQN